MGEEKLQGMVFTLEEVAQKTSPESYMLVIHNKVYDVTNFISETQIPSQFFPTMIQHPGGAEILLDVVGTDASEVFEEIGRHTTEARELMIKYCVGRLKS